MYIGCLNLVANLLRYKDCKDPILAPDWEPIWSLEQRSPTFISDEDIHGPRNPHSQGHALYALSFLLCVREFGGRVTPEK